MEEPFIAQKNPFVLPLEPGTYAWCACGKTSKGAFCDGTHKGSGNSPIIVEIDITKTVAFCGCRQSKSKPFCDGTHAKL